MLALGPCRVNSYGIPITNSFSVVIPGSLQAKAFKGTERTFDCTTLSIMLNNETPGYPEEAALTKSFYISIYSTICLTLAVRNLLSGNAVVMSKQTLALYSHGGEELTESPTQAGTEFILKDW